MNEHTTLTRSDEDTVYDLGELTIYFHLDTRLAHFRLSSALHVVGG